MSAASQAREKQVYEMFMSGKQYKTIEHELDYALTVTGIKQALGRHRKRHGLKNGRNVNIVRVGNRMKRIYG